MKNRLFTALSLSLLLSVPALAQSGMDHPMPTVQVVGSDYAYAGPASLSTGWTTFEFTNSGKEPHHLQLVRLPAGMTQESFLAGLKENEGATLAKVDMVGGVGMLLPGQKAQATVNLDQPGTYLELCFISDDNGVPHLALGMVRAFQVKAGTMSAKAPKADLAVKLMDFGIELPEGVTVKAGPQVWQVDNAGPEVHELTIMRLAPGKTMADVAAFMDKPEGPMPIIPVGGAQAVSKGRSSFVSLNLEAGDYVLLCAVPSPAHEGAPHFALGMLRPLTVVAR